MSAVSSKYFGSCDVYECSMAADSNSHIMKPTWSKVYEAQPCRLDFDSASAVDVTSGAAVVTQLVTLFCDSSLDIKAGSKVEVTQDGRTFTYWCSGAPIAYPSHQEISLTTHEVRA